MELGLAGPHTLLRPPMLTGTVFVVSNSALRVAILATQWVMVEAQDGGKGSQDLGEVAG